MIWQRVSLLGATMLTFSPSKFFHSLVIYILQQSLKSIHLPGIYAVSVVGSYSLRSHFISWSFLQMPRNAHEDFTLLQVRTLQKLLAPLCPLFTIPESQAQEIGQSNNKKSRDVIGVSGIWFI